MVLTRLVTQGAGAIAAPIVTALGRRPDAVLGKPAQNMLEAIYAE
jgi:4-nitrophenyl phosphatase